MKKIYLFTASFPYGKGEQFIEAEMKYIGSHPEMDITIVPAKITGAKRHIPSHVKLDPSLARWLNKYSLKRNPFALFLSLGFICQSVIQHKYLSLSAVLRIIHFAHSAKICSSWLKKRNIRDSICYTYWCNHLTLGALLNKSTNGNKVVTRVHGYDVEEERHQDSFLPFRDAILSQIDKVHCICDKWKRYLSEKYPSYKGKYTVSRLGIIDTVETLLNPPNYQGNKTVVFSCSFIVPLKRLPKLATSLVAYSKATGKKVIWKHIGDGDQVEKSEINHILSSHKETVEAEFLGYLPNHLVYNYYKENHINVFINTSEYEGIPVSIMEAISFGIPIIGCNVGGMSEIITDNGVLLPKDFSNEQFADAMDKVLTSANMREKSRENFLRDFEAFQNYTKFYSELHITP